MAFCLRLPVWAVFTFFVSASQISAADNLRAAAQIDSAASGFSNFTEDSVQFDLVMSHAVPFRVFNLAEPNRLVLDFQDIDQRALDANALLVPGVASDVRHGVFQPGWSRIVFDLTRPLSVRKTHMDTSGDGAHLVIDLAHVSEAEYLTHVGAADGDRWARPKISIPTRDKGETLRVAIDPGHGGIDPGAVRHGVMEKDIALDFSDELNAILAQRSDLSTFMTRDDDIFVSLSDRVRLTREADADLLISVHVNTVTFGDATGASVYTLSDRASDMASAKLAELENRADISAGHDAQVEENEVARVLVDMARVETNARSRIFADILVSELGDEVKVLRSKPHRFAGFKVLKAHDVPSVLLELGFMSNDGDRREMQDPKWRAKAAQAVVAAIDAWIEEDQRRSDLVLK